MKQHLTVLRSLLTQHRPWHRIVSAVAVLLSVGFLSWTAYNSWDALKQYSWQIHYVGLVPSFALYLVQTAIVVWAWQSVMNSVAHPLSFREHARIYALTNLMRRIPVGMLWVVAGRAYAYKDQHVSAGKSAFGSILEMWLIVWTALPLAALAGSALGFLPHAIGVALAGASSVLNLFMLHPRMLDRTFRWIGRQRVPAVLTYGTTLTWGVMYTLVWLTSGAGLFAMVRLFTNIPMEKLPATIGVWVLSSLVSYLTLLSPSGLGVKEFSLTVLLGVFLPDPLPLLTAIAMRLVWTIYDVVVGLVALLLKRWTVCPANGL